MDLLEFQSLIGIKGINKRSKRHCIHEYLFQSLIGIFSCFTKTVYRLNYHITKMIDST